MKKLHYFTITNQNQITLTLNGAFYAMNALEFKREIEPTICYESADIKLDLSRVDTIDLAGLNIIISMYNHLRRKNRKLEVLINEASPILELLHLTKFNDLLPISIAA